MKEIKTYTFPQGQQLADLEMVQVQVQVASRLVFKDAYFHELQEGDVYIIPHQVELKSESDTEILDYLIDYKISWQVMSSWKGEEFRCYYFFADNKLIKSVDFKSGDKGISRGVFREALSELIQEDEL
jgi:hypothetical protein